MKYLQSIEIQEHNKEEVLPGFTQDFPTTSARYFTFEKNPQIFYALL